MHSMQGDKLASGGRSATFYPSVDKRRNFDEDLDEMVKRGKLSTEALNEPSAPRALPALIAPRKPRVIIPLGPRIIVERDEAANTTASGLISILNPDAPPTGTILSVGDGPWEIYKDFKVGQEVIFGKFSGHEIDINGDGNKLTALREDEVIGIIKDA